LERALPGAQGARKQIRRETATGDVQDDENLGVILLIWRGKNETGC